MIARANEILSPYVLDVKHVAWNSVYEVGHRLTPRFDDVPPRAAAHPRVFIAGDACHTHSAKAGQGMNVSMQDGWNIGWKLGHVLEGRAPESLLATYSAERQVIAKNLIDFDREWSTIMATRPEDLPEPSYLEEFYQRTARVPGRVHDAVRAVDDRRRSPSTRRSRPGSRSASASTRRPSCGCAMRRRSTSGTWRRRMGAGASTCSASRSGFELPGPQEWFDVKVIYPRPYTEVDIQAVPAVFRPRSGRSSCSTTRTCSPCIRMSTSSPSAGSHPRARSWWSAPTSTSRTCCRSWAAAASLAAFFAGLRRLTTGQVAAT